MSRKDRTRLEALVLYFVERLSGDLGRTQIVKLLYLADLEARRHLGRPLSTLRWVKYKHGPFDAEILKALDRLARKGTIRREPVHFPSASGELFSMSPRATTHGFEPAEEAILAHIVRTYGQMPLRNLLEDVVYETKPMKNLPEDEMNVDLPMDSVDCEAIVELGGVKLEDVLEAEAQLDRGEGIRLEDLERDLLGRPGT